MKITQITKTWFKKNSAFIIVILCLLAFRWSLADQYRIPSGSMEPTIVPGDHVFVNKMAYDFKLPFTDLILYQKNNPERGDIIVFKYPEDTSILFIKRLIGIPGDHIVINDGFININGKDLVDFETTHSQLFHTTATFTYSEKISSEHGYQVKRTPTILKSQRLNFIVPADHYFFMGDNRDNSHDSRFWGFVPREYLKGKALFHLYSVTMENFLPQVALSKIGKTL